MSLDTHISVSIVICEKNIKLKEKLFSLDFANNFLKEFCTQNSVSERIGLITGAGINADF